LYTFFDPNDKSKSLVVGTELDVDGELYFAFHVDGKPVTRLGVFGKRYGKGAKDETAGQPDKLTTGYISRKGALELYDLLGAIFCGGDMDSFPPVDDMESPAHSNGISVADLLRKLEE
jgi:hypothetical protein